MVVVHGILWGLPSAVSNITKNKVGAQAKLVIKAAGKTRGFHDKTRLSPFKGGSPERGSPERHIGKVYKVQTIALVPETMRLFPNNDQHHPAPDLFAEDV